jgi:hypothetical protein
MQSTPYYWQFHECAPFRALEKHHGQGKTLIAAFNEAIGKLALSLRTVPSLPRRIYEFAGGLDVCRSAQNEHLTVTRDSLRPFHDCPFCLDARGCFYVGVCIRDARVCPNRPTARKSSSNTFSA